MRRQWRWFVLAALVLSGCDSSGQAAIGSVKAVLSPVAFVNDSMAGAGDDIPRSATLSTNNSGVLEFRLQDFSTICQLRPESKIVIEPSQNATFRYEQGAVWCQASTTPQRELVIDVGVRQLRVTQARFGLRRGQVVVDSGEGIISDTDGTPDKEKPAGEGQACDMETPRVVCAHYEPAPAEADILESVESSHEEELESSTDSPPSKTPETTGETPETTDKTPETTGETPETADKTPETTDKTPETTDKTPETTDETPES